MITGSTPVGCGFSPSFILATCYGWYFFAFYGIIEVWLGSANRKCKKSCCIATTLFRIKERTGESMNELIKVTVNEEQKQLVSARELHEYLEVGTHFKDWFPRMCEYGFVENQDFCSNLSESTGGRPSTEYQITIDMAKEICMLQRTEKGKQARQYFIELEKAWNNPEMVFARSLQFANQKMIEYKNKLELMQPMVEAYEDLLSTKNNHNMNEVAKLVGLGRNRLFEKLRQNKVLMNNNLPYESYMDRGYFTVREVIIHNSNYDDVKRQTLVTTKGVDWINKKLKEW